MKIESLWKDSQPGGGCPAIYEAPGGYVVEGKHLGETSRAQLRQLATRENASFEPESVRDRLKDLG
ncbi:hypothetical protein [Actinoallomurus sp. CA-142502]|uniref:hypothetical protein n=1 Tax=Actinoallomurus sp. CA-142502 TaxID=3239885 RepID=UPI003D90BC05